jgi:hypothetical protein
LVNFGLCAHEFGAVQYRSTLAYAPQYQAGTDTVVVRRQGEHQTAPDPRHPIHEYTA